MNADIKVFANSIMDKTGINISVYDLSGALVSGMENGVDVVPTDFEGVLSDTEKNLTYFHLRVKGKKYIAVLFGSGEAQKNYAFLISELAENSFSKEVGMSQSEFLRSVLLGEINYSQTARYMKKFSMNDRLAFVMLISVDANLSVDVQNILKTYMPTSSGLVAVIDETQLAIVKFIDDESEAYQSTFEYAEFLIRLLYEETGARVKIALGGTVKTVAGLNTSYSQAVTASRMSASVGNRGDVHSFKEYMLIKMLEDMPKYKLAEYLETLMDVNAKEIFDDQEMTNTAEEFLENSLNVSETSRNLYLHRNTLAYRLDKIEKQTGLNIRKFSDAVIFRLITILSRLVR